VAVECSLAALCLRYLTFECFEDDVEPPQLQFFALEGILSFQDYAVAKWLEHVRTILATSLEGFATSTDSQAALQEIEIALGEFSDCYEDDMLHNALAETAKQECEPFKKYPFYERLLHVWNHIYLHGQKGPGVRNNASVERLGEALARNRGLIENISASNLSCREKEKLTEFYGDRHFKCPKLTCFYFHEGFKDARSRDQHINRHDRPFSCVFPDCSIAEFGFPSNKELEKHNRFFHPEMDDQTNSFTTATIPPDSTKWRCDLCGKGFTRGFHQRAHMLSHSGTRPYACSECGRAFTRKNDCKRHEKIHSRR